MQLTVSNFIFTLNARLEFSSALSFSRLFASARTSQVTLYVCTAARLLDPHRQLHCTSDLVRLSFKVGNDNKLTMQRGARIRAQGQSMILYHFTSAIATFPFTFDYVVSMLLQDLDQKYSTGCVLSRTNASTSSSPRCFSYSLRCSH